MIKNYTAASNSRKTLISGHVWFLKYHTFTDSASYQINKNSKYIFTTAHIYKKVHFLYLGAHLV